MLDNPCTATVCAVTSSQAFRVGVVFVFVRELRLTPHNQLASNHSTEDGFRNTILSQAIPYLKDVKEKA